MSSLTDYMVLHLELIVWQGLALYLVGSPKMTTVGQLPWQFLQLFLKRWDASLKGQAPWGLHMESHPHHSILHSWATGRLLPKVSMID